LLDIPTTAGDLKAWIISSNSCIAMMHARYRCDAGPQRGDQPLEHGLLLHGFQVLLRYIGEDDVLLYCHTHGSISIPIDTCNTSMTSSASESANETTIIS